MAKQPFQLAGESLREIGVLLLVFAPLDTVLKKNGEHQDWYLTTGIGFFGLFLVLVGIYMGVEPEAEIVKAVNVDDEGES
jgi:hypothetical protein